MFDLYLFNTIVNVLWYLFTVLFVLYRYTTFFSYIYNFIRFCGKLFTGVSYVYKYINPVPQVDLEAQYNNRQTIYDRCKGYIVKNYNYYYRKFFKKQQDTSTENEYSELNAFPLIETNYGSNVNFSTQLNTSNEISKNNILKKRENDIFNKKMQELENSELEVQNDKCYIKNENEFYDNDKITILQDSNNYTFKIGENTTTSLSTDTTNILLYEDFKTDFIKSRSTYDEMCKLDEFYENVDILPSNDTL